MIGAGAGTMRRAGQGQPVALIAAALLAGLLTACTQTGGAGETAPATGTATPSVASVPPPAISDEDRRTQTAQLCREGPPVAKNWGRSAAHALIMEGWRQLEEGQPGPALDHFAASMVAGKERPDAYLGMLVAGHLAGYPDALLRDCFERAQIGMANAPELYADYGRVLEERGQPEAALVQFERALSLDPNFVAAHVGAGRSYLALGNEAKATEHAKEVERLMQGQQ